MKHLITHDSPIPLTKEQIVKPKPSTDVKNDAGSRSKETNTNVFKQYLVTYTSCNQIKSIKYD